MLRTGGLTTVHDTPGGMGEGEDVVTPDGLTESTPHPPYPREPSPVISSFLTGNSRSGSPTTKGTTTPLTEIGDP